MVFWFWFTWHIEWSVSPYSPVFVFYRMKTLHRWSRLVVSFCILLSDWFLFLASDWLMNTGFCHLIDSISSDVIGWTQCTRSIRFLSIQKPLCIYAGLWLALYIEAALTFFSFFSFFFNYIQQELYSLQYMALFISWYVRWHRNVFLRSGTIKGSTRSTSGTARNLRRIHGIHPIIMMNVQV